MNHDSAPTRVWDSLSINLTKDLEAARHASPPRAEVTQRIPRPAFAYTLLSSQPVPGPATKVASPVAIHARRSVAALGSRDPLEVAAKRAAAVRSAEAAVRRKSAVKIARSRAFATRALFVATGFAVSLLTVLALKLSLPELTRTGLRFSFVTQNETVAPTPPGRGVTSKVVRRSFPETR